MIKVFFFLLYSLLLNSLLIGSYFGKNMSVYVAIANVFKVLKILQRIILVLKAP